MKYRNRAQENTKVIRIHNGDYGLLLELAKSLGVAIGDCLHLVIEEKLDQKKTEPQSKEQIRMNLVMPNISRVVEPNVQRIIKPTVLRSSNGKS